MANLARRLDKLERLAHDLLNRRSGPVYLRAEAEVPEGVDPDRVIWIERVLIDPPEQPQEQLPVVIEPSPAIEPASPSFSRRLAEPPLGIV
jgi:hypothetical protein